MLKKSITYTDLNGDEVTEDHYFHLSKADLVELEMSHKGGLAKWLQRIVAEEDGAKIVAEFKNLILKSYGEKSDDGRRFIKDWQKTEEFQSSEAYSTLFIELCTDAGAAAEFVNGIVPQGLEADVEKMKLGQEGHPSDPAATPAEPRWPNRTLGDDAPTETGRNVFERGEVDPTAVQPRLLSRDEVEEMDAVELKAGLADGRYKLS